MPHSGLLGKYEFHEETEDIRGGILYGVDDEKLGKIDDVIFDHDTGKIQYIVVDTGGWLNSKKFLVPSEHLRASSKHEDDFSVDLTKKDIETFPFYNERDLESEERWADYEDRYRSRWETGPVMHRVGTDRNITPTTQQQTGNRSSLVASGSAAPRRPLEEAIDEEGVMAASATTERVAPPGTDAVVIEHSAVGIGGRWDTFQARLRERRKEAVTGCRTCNEGPISSRGSEGADTLKKAV
jgi:sporulation protein YlmC with PRC-barrel domain